MATARKKAWTAKDIMNQYFEYVLEHGEQPKSVYTFAKAHGHDEGEFYKFFGTFDIIENEFFNVLYQETIKVIAKDKDFKNADARGKLLTFYYTYFENLTANRSFVKEVLSHGNQPLKGLKKLDRLRTEFKEMIGTLDLDTIDFKNEDINNVQLNALKEGAWLQFLLTLKFWLDDHSPSFEKTDVFIEKAVNTSFDLMDTKPIKSLFDFGKFILQEKTSIKV